MLKITARPRADITAAVLMVGLMTACASQPAATLPSTTPSPTLVPTLEPTPTPQPTPSPTPTPEPTPDLAALGEQYLALLEEPNRHACSFTDAMLTDLALYRAYMTEAADHERVFVDALRAIEFPPQIQPHVDELIAAGASYESVARIVGAASSFEEVNSLLDRLDDANFRSRDASNLIRGDLGLPSSPTCDELDAGE